MWRAVAEQVWNFIKKDITVGISNDKANTEKVTRESATV
jgi:hypothetical protein